ncbi:adenosine deaminase [Sediminibacillus albus]|uniref:Adenosine deaminase n=1 Tax=Sediminibacillus albus TaxID=407036 RepID=A0A1G8YA25_9BACI|nr:adenosine deaminase [Sediminibacillus albus]
MNSDLYSLIQQLPKVDLHVHLDGSIKPETVLDLANQQGMDLPAITSSGLLPYLQVTDNCKGLNDYLSKFQLGASLLQTEAALERVAFETIEQASEHNCRYIEVRFGPQLHRQRGLGLEQVIQAVINGLQKGEKAFGIKAQAIVCCLRHQPASVNLKVVEAAAMFLGKGVAAVDLAGDEAGFPAFLFRKVFALAEKKGLPITIHAGEAAGPENIREAVSRLGAGRIGHGISLKQDPVLLQEICTNKIPLEMCPISNIQTKAADSWQEYPIREYFEQGLTVTVNTDNLTVSNTDLTKEYMMLAEKLDFTITEIVQLIRNGVEAAFLDMAEKNLLKHQFVNLPSPQR